MLHTNEKLNKISKVFDINKVLSAEVSVQKYYQINKLAYSVFHSKEGYIHVGISRDGKYKKEDLVEPVKFIHSYLKNRQKLNVLELATGRGSNSAYLAIQNPDSDFIGIDISKSQMGFAKNAALKIKNYTAEYGDYHNLSKFKDNTFDIVFEVDAVCHSNDKKRVLTEANRVLKQGGLFILIDGYLRNNLNSYTEDEKTTLKLVEIGMSLKDLDTYDFFIESARAAGFNLDYEEDISNFILPTLEKHEKLATLYFKYPFIARMINKLLPKEFLYNAISGYLWADTIKNGTACYYITVLKK